MYVDDAGAVRATVLHIHLLSYKQAKNVERLFIQSAAVLASDMH